MSAETGNTQQSRAAFGLSQPLNFGDRSLNNFIDVARFGSDVTDARVGLARPAGPVIAVV
jgi:hypothetical protein